ncbi:probable hexosyltransferase MUCI70 [Typha latifolia]|uniref:probable hexosyltransferase MUCI70 n=1 Tax=Typha latifolia TaxID=4733 RepID=UPI003C305424
MIQSISISVSDDDEDKVWIRPRRKKRARRRRPELLPRVVRKAMRWWPVLLFFPLLALFFFEFPKLVRLPRELPQPDPVTVTQKSVPAHEEGKSHPVSMGNIHKPGNTSRIVRKPCLKILSPEKVVTLEFPATGGSNYSVKRVLYRSDEGNATQLLQPVEAARFNLFTGYQTLHEREESFKVKESAVVHCGFYSEIGGFTVSDNDKRYMQTCKAVVSTCAFGGGDDLYQPIGMTEASIEKVCYVAFWDVVTRSAQEAEGKVIGDNHMIGRWRIVVVRNLPFSDQRLNGKIPKMLSHRLFPEARYSIWVDSKSQFKRDPIGVLEALLWHTKSVFAISEHGARSNLHDEAKAVVKKHKATSEEVEVQLNQYSRDGVPDDKRLNGKKALAEASVIVREHTPSTNLFMCLWFNEVVRFTSRDQLSFPYVLRRLKIPGVNIFPVCARKDLVNSMGHKRKVKPLLLRQGS